MTLWKPERLGAVFLGDDRCRFAVWAPKHDRVAVHVLEPNERHVPLERGADGVHRGTLDDVGPGTRYLYVLGGDTERPDPASRHQPEGVHGPSEVVDFDFSWSDGAFCPPALEDLLLYELHVGTFSASGTFDGIIPELDRLVELGINAIELMPVAAFPGRRNWGYDGVYPSATQASYGGPKGLQRFVDACHARGVAVALDVVHNHLGPEGNYFGDFGPYFSQVYKTPWGYAMNFDDAGSDGVRRFFIESTLGWVMDYHVDILRLDAIHAIFDRSAEPYLRELGRSVRSFSERAGRRVLVIAESDLNDPRVVQPPEVGGHGLDAQWSDDFHHALHALVTGEDTGYYADFGRVSDLARAYREAYVYSGRFSRYRDRSHGSPASACEGRRFVVCSQNHDQVGNRARGDRLSENLSFSQEKLLSCALLLSPYVPLLFMGQEYGETAPFQYFTNFGDADLAEAVRRGRRAEFRAFGWSEDEVPDPEDPVTFERSRLTRARRETPQGRALEALHGALIVLRRSHPALRNLDRRAVTTEPDDARRLLVVRRDSEEDSVVAVFAFGSAAEVPLGECPGRERMWTRLIDTETAEWGGGGGSSPSEAPSGATVHVSGHSAVVYSALDPRP